MSLGARYRTEIVLFLVSFVAHMAFVGVVQYAAGAHGFISYSDAEHFFYRLALNLNENGAFSLAHQAPYVIDAYHTPLYPLVLAALLAIGLPLWGVALVQGIAASLTVVLTYRIAQILTVSRRLAIGAGAIAIVEPVALYWSGILVSDTFFALLSTAAVYALMCRRFVALGAMLGLATLTRPVMLYLAPLFFVMGVYLSYSSLHSLWTLFRKPLMILSVMSIVVFPWFLHNKLTADTWAFSTAGWYDFYMHPLPAFAEEYGLDVPVVNVPPDPDFSRFNFEYMPMYRDAFFSVVRENPIGYALVHAKRVFFSIFSNRYEYLLEVVIRSEMPALYAALSSVGTMLFLAVGTFFWMSVYALIAIAAFEKSTRVWWLFAAVLVGANFVIAGAIHPDGGAISRYMLSVHALFFAFAMVGVQTLLRLRTIVPSPDKRDTIAAS